MISTTLACCSVWRPFQTGRIIWAHLQIIFQAQILISGSLTTVSDRKSAISMLQELQQSGDCFLISRNLGITTKTSMYSMHQPEEMALHALEKEINMVYSLLYLLHGIFLMNHFSRILISFRTASCEQAGDN